MDKIASITQKDTDNEDNEDNEIDTKLSNRLDCKSKKKKEKTSLWVKPCCKVLFKLFVIRLLVVMQQKLVRENYLTPGNKQTIHCSSSSPREWCSPLNGDGHPCTSINIQKTALFFFSLSSLLFRNKSCTKDDSPDNSGKRDQGFALVEKNVPIFFCFCEGCRMQNSCKNYCKKKIGGQITGKRILHHHTTTRPIHLKTSVQWSFDLPFWSLSLSLAKSNVLSVRDEPTQHPWKIWSSCVSFINLWRWLESVLCPICRQQNQLSSWFNGRSCYGSVSG